jgi:hypothetical protein
MPPRRQPQQTDLRDALVALIEGLRDDLGRQWLRLGNPAPLARYERTLRALREGKDVDVPGHTLARALHDVDAPAQEVRRVAEWGAATVHADGSYEQGE